MSTSTTSNKLFTLVSCVALAGGVIASGPFPNLGQMAQNSTALRVVDRFLLHEDLDGWGLMNAATNVLWHDERATAATLSWNEYVSTGLVEYALGQPRSN